MTQSAFNFARDEVLIPRDTHVVEPEEVKRLTGQNAAIYARLRRGPATNVELAKMSLKYTSRLSDIRQKAGVTIIADRKSRGLTIYRLEASCHE